MWATATLGVVALAVILMCSCRGRRLDENDLESKSEEFEFLLIAAVRLLEIQRTEERDGL